MGGRRCLEQTGWPRSGVWTCRRHAASARRVACAWVIFVQASSWTKAVRPWVISGTEKVGKINTLAASHVIGAKPEAVRFYDSQDGTSQILSGNVAARRS